MKNHFRFIPLTITAVILINLFWENYDLIYKSGPLTFRDFDVYYIAAKLIREGKNPYDRSLGQREVEKLIGQGILSEGPWFYSPFSSYIYLPSLAVFLIPIQEIFSLRDGRFIWLILMLISFFVSLCFFLQTISQSDDQWKKNSLFLLFIMLALYSPVAEGISHGNANFLIFFVLTIFLYFMNKNKEIIASLALSFGILIKITPLVFLPWLFLRKRKKLMAYTSFTLASFILLEFIFFRTFEYWIKFIYDVLPEISAGAITSFSIYGFFLRIFSENPVWSPAAIDLGIISIMNRPDVAKMLTRIAVAAFVGISALALMERFHNFKNIKLEFALLVILINLITPVVWYHGLIFCLLAIMIAFVESEARASKKAYFLIGLVSSTIFLPFAIGWKLGVGENPLLNLFTNAQAVTLFGMINLWWIFIFILFKQETHWSRYFIARFGKGTKWIAALIGVLIVNIIGINFYLFYKDNRIYFPYPKYYREEYDIDIKEPFEGKNVLYNSEYSFIHASPESLKGSCTFKIGIKENIHALLVKPTVYTIWKGDTVDIFISSDGTKYKKIYSIKGYNQEFRFKPTIRPKIGRGVKEIFLRFDFCSNRQDRLHWDPRLEELKIDFVFIRKKENSFS